MKTSRKNWKKPRYWALLEFRSPELPSRLAEAERGKISAGLERKVAFGVVETAISDLRACYDEALADGLPKGAFGHTDLHLLVTPQGTVSYTFISDSFDQDIRPTQCVTQTLEGLAFPANDVSTDFYCRVPFKGPARCSAKTSL